MLPDETAKRHDLAMQQIEHLSQIPRHQYQVGGMSSRETF